MPPLDTLLDDLGNPTAKELAHAVRVSERTARSYIKSKRAPHAVMLALFWVSRWGQQWVHVDAHNDATHFHGLAMAYERENRQLRKLIDRLLADLRFSSANDPATLEGVSLRDRALSLRDSAPKGSDPIRVTIPNARTRYARR